MNDLWESLSKFVEYFASLDQKKRRKYYPKNWDEWARWTKERANYQCEECGAVGVPLFAHHIVPLSEGGKTVPSNLIALCRDCHTVKDQYTHGRYLERFAFRTIGSKFGLKPHQYLEFYRQYRTIRDALKALNEIFGGNGN